MKKVLQQTVRLLIIVLLLNGCNWTDDESVSQQIPVNTYGKKSVKDDPVASYLKNAINFSSNGRTEDEVDDSVAYYVDQTGLTSYSFLTSGDNLERIVNTVFINRDSNYLNYNIIYEPTKNHLSQIDQIGTLLYDFSGKVSYESVNTGEIFYAFVMENGEVISESGESAGRTEDGQYDCYPDQQWSVSNVCYANRYEGSYNSNERAYKTIDHSSGKATWKGSVTDNELINIEIVCLFDKDFSECDLTWFNTQGYTTIPQYARGSGTLAGVTLSPIIEPTNLPNNQNFVNAVILNMLEDNKYLLLDADCDEIDNWLELAQNQASDEIIDKLDDLDENHSGLINGWQIQSLQDAGGTVVNMDYFAVNITDLPNDPATGQELTPEGMLNYFRRNINDFADKFSPYCEIESICDQETALWESNNPTGAIQYIDIPLNDGVVICSYYSPTFWHFMTLEAPVAGNHPVSGTREFGIELGENGGYNIYVRGVDRLESAFDEFVGDRLFENAFNPADELWQGFQSKMNDFVNSNGGTSTIVPPEANRPNWEKLKEILAGTRPISDLGCN